MTTTVRTTGRPKGWPHPWRCCLAAVSATTRPIRWPLQAAGDSTAIATTEASDSDEANEADETDGETPVEDEQVLVLA